MRFIYKCRVHQSKENVFTLNCEPLNNPYNKRKVIVFLGDVEKLKNWLRKKKSKDTQTNPPSLKKRTYQQMIDQIIEGSDPYIYIWSNMIAKDLIVKETFFKSKLDAKKWLQEICDLP